MWKKWSNNLYNDFDIEGIQDKYDDINAWEDEGLRTICAELWNILDDKQKKLIYATIITIVTKYGIDIARKIVQKIVDAFKIDGVLVPE